MFTLVTTDSTASDDDSLPPPLPIKTRESSDYSNLISGNAVASNSLEHENYSIVSSEKWLIRNTLNEMETVENSNYEYVETRNSAIVDDKRRPPPPTPPPKPSRNSSKYAAN